MKHALIVTREIDTRSSHGYVKTRADVMPTASGQRIFECARDVTPAIGSIGIIHTDGVTPPELRFLQKLRNEIKYRPKQVRSCARQAPVIRGVDFKSAIDDCIGQGRVEAGICCDGSLGIPDESTGKESYRKAIRVTQQANKSFGRLMAIAVCRPEILGQLPTMDGCSSEYEVSQVWFSGGSAQPTAKERSALASRAQRLQPVCGIDFETRWGGRWAERSLVRIKFAEVGEKMPVSFDMKIDERGVSMRPPSRASPLRGRVDWAG